MYSLMPGLSVILPFHNGRADVADAIKAALRAAAHVSDEYEVIVVDDGSTDGTATVASRFARSDQRVRLVVHSGPQGYGAALRSGIRAADKQWLLLTDGYLRIGLHNLEDFVAAARHSDLVVGWRVMRDGPAGQRARVATWNGLAERVFDLPVHDVDCPLKLVRRELFERVELTATDAMVGPELVVKSLATGGQVSEVAFREPPYDASRTAHVRGIVRAIGELAGLYRPLRALRRRRDEGTPQGATQQAPRAPRATPG
jgi:dolichol-phosphate mannosyltransferase